MQDTVVIQVAPVASARLNSSRTISKDESALELWKRRIQEGATEQKILNAFRKWFSDLLSKSETTRGIPVPPLEEQMFRHELELDNYHPDQAVLAELWILKGDWDKRGTTARLELSDFYVPVQKIQYLIDMHGLRVVSKSEYELTRQKWYDEGRRSVQQQQQVEHMSADDREMLREVVRLKHDLATEREHTAELTERIAEHKRHIESLKALIQEKGGKFHDAAEA